MCNEGYKAHQTVLVKDDKGNKDLLLEALTAQWLPFSLHTFDV